MLLFSLSATLYSNNDLYFTPYQKVNTRVLLLLEGLEILLPSVTPLKNFLLLPLNKTKLLYQVNRMTGVQCLYISPFLIPNILAIAHENWHPSSSHCYEFIMHSWFIQGLIKLLWAFIRHYSKCSTLLTKKHIIPYSLLSYLLFSSTD